MPINIGKDKKGNYYHFGDKGKKYYFDPHNAASIRIAYNKTLKQSRAIEWSKHRKK